MDSTSRGATGYLSKGQGRLFSEEQRAKENAYIQKWEKEKMEKQKQQAEKEIGCGKKVNVPKSKETSCKRRRSTLA